MPNDETIDQSLVAEYEVANANFRSLATYRFGLLTIFLGYGAFTGNAIINSENYLLIFAIGFLGVIGNIFVIISESRFQDMYLIILEELVQVETRMGRNDGMFQRFNTAPYTLRLRDAAKFIYVGGAVVFLAVTVYGIVRVAL